MEAWCPKQSPEFQQRGKRALLCLGLFFSTISTASLSSSIWMFHGFEPVGWSFGWPFLFARGDQRPATPVHCKGNLLREAQCNMNKPTTPQHFWSYDNSQWGLMTSQEKPPWEISTSCLLSLPGPQITSHHLYRQTRQEKAGTFALKMIHLISLVQLVIILKCWLSLGCWHHLIGVLALFNCYLPC